MRAGGLSSLKPMLCSGFWSKRKPHATNGAVCTSGEALNIADAYKDARFNRRTDASTGYRTRTILCVPIKNQRGEVVGVVQCINKRTYTSFTQEDLANLDEFCWQVAAVLEAPLVRGEGLEEQRAGLGSSDGSPGGSGGCEAHKRPRAIAALFAQCYRLHWTESICEQVC